MIDADVGQRIVAEARRWLDTPYHHQGDVLGVGVDCAMLPVRVLTGLQLIPADFDPRPYPPDWMLHRSEERYLTCVERFAAKVEEARAGDLSLYRVGRCIAHGGICENASVMIHADLHAGRVVRREIHSLAHHMGFWRLTGG